MCRSLTFGNILNEFWQLGKICLGPHHVREVKPRETARRRIGDNLNVCRKKEMSHPFDIRPPTLATGRSCWSRYEIHLGRYDSVDGSCTEGTPAESRAQTLALSSHQKTTSDSVYLRRRLIEFVQLYWWNTKITLNSLNERIWQARLQCYL